MHALLLVLVAVTPVQEVRDHADAIVELQLADGAIVHYHDGDQITIVPYFGNYAALGLFEAYRVTRDTKYLDAAIAWTDWYLDHMEPSGAIYDYQGTRDSYRSSGSRDSTDAYAATFLICADVRRTLTKDFRFVMRERDKLFAVYSAMMATADDADGLTCAKPDYPQKLTMDNAEVYQALWHTRQLAEVVRDMDWVQSTYYARRKIKKAFADMRGPDGLYPWVQNDPKANAAAREFYPAGLSNLVAVAVGPVGWHKAKATVRSTFEAYPDLESCAPDHLYWWIAAARRVHRNDIALNALEAFRRRAGERGLAVDHAHYIRALSRMKRLAGGRLRSNVPVGSTFIATPRSSS